MLQRLKPKSSENISIFNIFELQEHMHEPDHDSAQASKVRKALKRKASDRFDSPGQIIQKVTNACLRVAMYLHSAKYESFKYGIDILHRIQNQLVAQVQFGLTIISIIK